MLSDFTFFLRASSDSNSRRARLIWMCLGTSGMRKVRMNLKASSPCWNHKTDTVVFSFFCMLFFWKSSEENIVWKKDLITWFCFYGILPYKIREEREDGMSGWDRQHLYKCPWSWMTKTVFAFYSKVHFQDVVSFSLWLVDFRPLVSIIPWWCSGSELQSGLQQMKHIIIII